MEDRMKQAYEAATIMLAHGLSPLQNAALRRLTAEEIVVVAGQYDRVQDVLQWGGIPCRVVEAGSLERQQLLGHQVVVINCPGNVGVTAVKNVRAFVEAGGRLVTTDWSLTHVIQSAFPGVLKYNSKPTEDAVVGIQIVARDHPLLEGVFHDGANPRWWLEGMSYPFSLVSDEATLLIRSVELQRNWGQGAVAATFPHGRGEVLHVISHSFLKRVESQHDWLNAPWRAYARERDLESAWRAAPRALRMLKRVEVEAAYTSLRLLANFLLAGRAAEVQGRASHVSESRRGRGQSTPTCTRVRPSIRP